MLYLNEIDHDAAAWLRELMADGQIAAGEIDTRSIVDLTGDDLNGYREAHFFAGIGGWPLAVRLAGWPAGRELWTGSCPCQPFSNAGKRRGFADERHLWPAWFRLIRERRPECVVGEQVESAIRHGWLDGVFADLEAEGYACGSIVLGAHSVGAPHIRQRLFWVATTEWKRVSWSADCGDDDLCSLCGDDYTECNCPGPTQDGYEYAEFSAGLCARRVGEPEQPRLEGHAGDGHDGRQPGRNRAEQAGSVATTSHAGPWSDCQLIPCRDGKTRRIPVEPAFFPLADGVPGRVGLLRGAGNAIVPQVAAEFLSIVMEILP